MPSAFAHAQVVKAWSQELLDVIADARAAFDAGTVAPSTFHSVIELTALQIHSRFETFLEELFLSCLVGESGIEIERTVEPVSRTNAYSLLGGDGRDGEYFTWLPLDRTMSRAVLMFRFGRPFSRLIYRPAVTSALKELVVVRNAVAHPSQVAQRKLVELALQNGYVVARPADFLLAVRDGRPEIENFISMMRAVAVALAEPAETDVTGILGPERKFVSGEKSVPPGSYVCDNCATALVLRTTEDLQLCACKVGLGGPCLVCGQNTPCATCSKPRAPQSTYERTPM